MSDSEALQLPFDGIDVPGLIGIWRQAMDHFLEAATAPGADAWHAATPLPGWDVADVVAHVISIERFLLKAVDPPHEPDWSVLPHVKGDFSFLTEIPVDLRRSRSREDVLAEFRETMAERQVAMEDGPQELSDLVDSPFGIQLPLDRMLRTRIFDTWVHEQDVRAATGQSGDLATPPAWIAARQLASALGFVWGKSVGAPVGTTAEVVVTGPGVTFAATIRRGEDGRGISVPPQSEPTVRVTLSWPDFVDLGCGRVPAEQGPGLAQLGGDAELAARLATQLCVTP